MSDTIQSLGRKIGSADDLQSVVRTMKAMAASSIVQYENAVRALDDYHRTVQLGLSACFRHDAANVTVTAAAVGNEKTGTTAALVFGSDQGLVGQFNDSLVNFTTETLAKLPGEKTIWSVGERIHTRLADSSFQAGQNFILPGSIHGITPLIGQILIEMETQREQGKISQVYLFHNRPQAAAVYVPVCERLLPLDDDWRAGLAAVRWPTKCLPELMASKTSTMLALVHEYLFVSLFKACAESLASENASRLAAMQRAEKNIDELLEDLNRTFHRLRQSGIDEELFDLVSGFEALNTSRK